MDKVYVVRYDSLVEKVICATVHKKIAEKVVQKHSESELTLVLETWENGTQVGGEIFRPKAW